MLWGKKFDYKKNFNFNFLLYINIKFDGQVLLTASCLASTSKWERCVIAGWWRAPSSAGGRSSSGSSSSTTCSTRVTRRRSACPPSTSGGSNFSSSSRLRSCGRGWPRPEKLSRWSFWRSGVAVYSETTRHPHPPSWSVRLVWVYR